MAQVTLCLHRSSSIHVLFILALYQSHWQFFPDVSRYPMGVWAGWWGGLGTSSHLSHLPFLFSLWEQPFHHSDSRRGKVLSVCSEFLCKYIHSVKKCVLYEWCVFAFFLSLYNAGRSFPLPVLSWLEKVKRHLTADSCFTSHKVFLVIFFCPISS